MRMNHLRCVREVGAHCNATKHKDRLRSYPCIAFLFLQGSIFADGRCLGFNFSQIHVPYNRAYFMGLIFTVRRSSAKTTKTGHLKNFPLYDMNIFTLCKLDACNACDFTSAFRHYLCQDIHVHQHML